MSGLRTLRPETRRRVLSGARLGGGALIIVVLVLRLGTGPFLDGVRRVDAASLSVAIVITALTTVVSAWRWRAIARALGMRISLGAAVASYYRSQFLNSMLPGGVLGDLHRGVRVGEEANDVSRGLRSVVWDRVAGQIVQVVLATGILLTLASPVRAATTIIVGVTITALVIMAMTVLAIPTRSHSWVARVASVVRSDVRVGMLTARVGPTVLIASALVVAGHVGVFIIATEADGSPISLWVVLPLAMLVLLSMTVPTSIGGWGPREGVAAWAFAVAGFGADRGVEIATTYGVLSLVATLPGAVVLVLMRRPRPPVHTAAVSTGGPNGALVGSGHSAHG